MNSITTLSTEQLKRAIEIKTQIENLEDELETLFDGAPVLTNGRGRRTMNAAARARIGAAQRARWAKAKGTTATQPAKKRRKMSAEGRARIAAAARARWAKFRTEKK